MKEYAAVRLLMDHLVETRFVLVQIWMFFESDLLGIFMSFNEIWGYQMIEEKKTQKISGKVVDSDKLK
ncbi:hypothetical protein ACHAL6_13730 [Proteiniclasticum sp. C24MP]|uniref:hypothetical protein n=1 Tax=Proteiniclasticum sp. C24MP TaxID=3374101 RepID=UPI00375514F6